MRALVFTDLDGCLLDHDSYSFDAALPALDRLDELQIPVVFNSSKTKAEMLSLRRTLRNQHPFISENGAGVFMPLHYFEQQPAGTKSLDDFWVREFGVRRSDCRQVLDRLRVPFQGQFTAFSDLDTQGIAQLTGLDAAAAQRSAQRDFSEPVHWLGDEAGRQKFVDAVRANGLQTLQGGRFLTLGGAANKGAAMTWLRAQYARAWRDQDIEVLAIGDSGNDVDMLEAASHALLVRSPAHALPALRRDPDTITVSDQTGPAGWAEGVVHWLDNVNSEQSI
ncbi:MAG: HAD-IIB family hydrolase [Pseudomonadota bacterium]